MNVNEAELPVVEETLSGTEEVTEATEDQELEPSQVTEEPATEEETNDVEDKPKKASGFHRRIQRFEAKLSEKDQELNYWRQLALDTGKAQAAPTKQEKLSLADFDSVEDYVEARENQLKAQLLREVQETAQKAQKEVQVRDSYSSKVSEAKSLLPDFDDVMEDAADEPTAPETVQFCLESDVGPRIAYHLAKNPELHERINNMSPIRRVAELGKIEDLIKKPVAVEPRVSRAPGKLTEVKGTASTVLKHPGEATTFAEWKALDAARRRK